MSLYKSLILGSNKKKKVIGEQPKPKKTIVDWIKQELNEWNDTSFKDLPKRWGGAYGRENGLTEYEQELKEVGAAPLYRKHVKSIDKTRDLFGREVLKFYELLRKKGLDDVAGDLLDNYKNNVIKFGKEFKELIRRMI